MADIGYTVNFAAADPYTKPTAISFVASQPSPIMVKPARLNTSPASIDALLANWSALSSDLKKWTAKA